MADRQQKNIDEVAQEGWLMEWLISPELKKHLQRPVFSVLWPFEVTITYAKICF